MTIKKRIIQLSIIFLVISLAVQAVAFVVINTNSATASEQIETELVAQDEQEIENNIQAIAGSIETFLLEKEETIDNEMLNAALVLQTMDTFKKVKQTDLDAVTEKTGMNDMYIGDMDGIFTLSTVPESIGMSLFDVWDGYRMLVTGESEELPSNLKVMEETGEIYKFTAIPRYDRKGNLKGVIESALNAEQVESAIKEMVKEFEMLDGLHLFQPDGLVLASNPGANATEAYERGTMQDLANVKKALESDKPIFVDAGDKGGKIFYYKVIERLGGPAYVIQLEFDKSYYQAGTEFVSRSISTLSDTFLINLAFVTGISLVILILIIAFYYRITRNYILEPIAELQDVTNQLALGDVAVELDTSREDEIGELQRDFARMVASIHDQAEYITKIADGDYTADVAIRSDKDIMSKAIADTIESNNVLIAEIRNASGQVDAGAQQMAQGAQNLAAGATEQAGEIDAVTSMLESVVGQTEENAQSAQEALKVSDESTQMMEVTAQTMEKMLLAMQEIEDSSQNISNIIKVIEDIAFQTNILALNAAVEAARAGVSGQGFAVVAEEVGNLASRSAEAANQTAVLIEGSSAHVQDGNKLVDQTNKDLKAVRESIEQSFRLMQSITEASEEQKIQMNDLGSSMQQISEVVQTNSATSQEVAAAAEEMSSQSAVLREMVSRFKLKEKE